MNLCVKTSALAHGYQKDQPVVKTLNMEVPKGAIYGFLGPNGAGKTTTLKLLLGLIKPTSGEINIFDRSLKEHRVDILKSIGSLIESPSIYGHLNARENLKVWQVMYGSDHARINEVLSLVGLSDTGNKKASKFSLGMKQRLAIAAALLHHPELLILDEPTNGLDPQGIIEMRDLLRKLNAVMGVTIIISSHLLSEVEKLVTHVGIIHQGSLKFQGTWAELKSLQQNSQAIVWRTSDNERTMSLLDHSKLFGGELITKYMQDTEVAQINRKLISEGIDIYEVRPQAPDLENIFLQMTQ
jgi:ABC-type multidrug transport system ATPase subunit